MSGFRYKHGDRPLDGFTIQHAAGRGGFGEVYYAVSDSGREVALKVIGGYEHIELRGVGHCMNLKSPHLVSVFDVKKNADGVPFVIMEYVSGPSLRQIIDESPGGLGTQKAAFFLREIAKGLQYLHDCGIVHRDLKPGNIFYENGYVKIGDYGLSKAMTASQHSGQTITVGTVHYMAPEIGVGKYDRSIDIYALGAVLFEMLTGQPPYLGASPGEILMKHLSAVPDVSHIEEPFATAITRAMNKDPKQRFQNVQEMVEAVFGAEHVRNSVMGFSPESLTMVAGRVAGHVAGRIGAGQAVGVGGGALGSSVVGGFSPERTPPPSDAWELGVGGAAVTPRNRLAAVEERYSPAFDRPEAAGASAALEPVAEDPIPWPQRMMLGGMTLLLISGASAASTGTNPGASAVFALLVAAGATAGLALSRRLFAKAMAREKGWHWRLPFVAVACLPALALSVPVIAGTSDFRFAGKLLSTVAAVAAALCVYDWNDVLRPGRKARVAGDLVFYTCLTGAIVAAVIGGYSWLSVGILAAVGLAAQSIAPFHGGKAARPKQAPAGRDVQATIAMPPPIPADAPRLERMSFAASTTSAAPATLASSAPATPTSPGVSSNHVAASSYKVTLADIATFPIAMAGHIVLIMCAVLGLLLAVDLPGALASGVFNQQLKGQLERELGSQTWHTLARSLGYVLLCVGIFAADALLIFARRWDGAAHMLRAFFASFFLLGAVRFLHGACTESWIALSKNPATAQPGPGIEAFLSGVTPTMAGFSLFLALVSLVTILWPARRAPQGSVVQEAKS